MDVVWHHTGGKQLVPIPMEMPQGIKHNCPGRGCKLAPRACAHRNRIDCPRPLKMWKPSLRIPGVFVSGSTPVPGVGFGVPPKRTLLGSPRKRDAFANTRDGRAPRNFLSRISCNIHEIV